MLVTIIAFAMIYIGSGSALYTIMQGRVERAYERGKNRAVTDLEDELRRRGTEWRRPTFVRIPNFGEPTFKVYDPAEFDLSITCTSCQKILQAGEPYYEIPITNVPGGGVAGVHLKCERAVKFG